MTLLNQLKNEIKVRPEGEFYPQYYRSIGYRNGKSTSPSGRRADGITALFCQPVPFIYKSDLIAGSLRPLFVSISDEEKQEVKTATAPYPERNFFTNNDHFSPDYKNVVSLGIGGLLKKISDSESKHASEPDSLDFLNSMRLTLLALQSRILAHAKKARELKGVDGYDAERLDFIAKNCEFVANNAPETFAQGLQLVFMIHTCFLYESRDSMALGRLDQYLYELYRHDIEAGTLTKEQATELLENTLVKICERRFFIDDDDVVNICIGGVDANNKCAVNELSYCIIEAVKNINLPGPNLSARIAPDTPDEFLDKCLQSIGTGLGYPALMNDTVNMEALRRFGYAEEDVRDYTMVGCIENFITGKQPAWSDSRFDTPRFIEYTLLGGEGYEKGMRGLVTADISEISTMEEFMDNLKKQLEYGAEKHMESVYAKNEVKDPENMTCPFLSCFCEDCIGRARDINMGGAIYPSVHGVALMGVGTMTDSLSAIEKVVFCDKEATLSDIAEAMRANFVGYDELREKLVAAPKYGNNDNFADKYAIWFTEYLTELFDNYRTYDGGYVYTAMAANISNIAAGKRIGATPDGRLAGRPLSDAASPTYGCDTKGATSTLLSVSKPDYSLCACGTVVNQKYSPSMFEDGKREKLLQLIKVYFAKGGQEIQINATSTEVLRDAMEHPENYQSLVVRVSGFSALYVTLSRAVQEDILCRTQQ